MTDDDIPALVARLRGGSIAKYEAIAALERLDAQRRADAERHSAELEEPGFWGRMAANASKRARDAIARAEAAEGLLRETVDALENIESDARTPQDTYNRVGPTWTGKDGHEYADMDHLLDKCNELADSIHAVIEKAAPALAVDAALAQTTTTGGTHDQ